MYSCSPKSKARILVEGCECRSQLRELCPALKPTLIPKIRSRMGKSMEEAKGGGEKVRKDHTSTCRHHWGGWIKNSLRVDYRASHTSCICLLSCRCSRLRHLVIPQRTTKKKHLTFLLPWTFPQRHHGKPRHHPDRTSSREGSSFTSQILVTRSPPSRDTAPRASTFRGNPPVCPSNV